MKKRTRALLTGEAIRRTLAEVSRNANSADGIKLNFNEHGMTTPKWTEGLEPVCELTLQDHTTAPGQPGDITLSVAIYNKSRIEFHVSGSTAENSQFDQFENHFKTKKDGGIMLQRAADFLQDEFQIPAHQFLSEFDRQATSVREEHRKQKQARRALKTLGF